MRRRPKNHFQRIVGCESLEPRMMLTAAPVVADVLTNFTAVNSAVNVPSQSGLLSTAFDLEGSSLTVSIVDNPAHGDISNLNSSTGTFTYAPDTDWSGIDTFTFTVSDGSATSHTASAAIAVEGHFGARTNAEELPRFTGEPAIPAAMPMGCSANSTPVQFGGSCLTGDVVFSQTVTPGLQ